MVGIILQRDSPGRLLRYALDPEKEARIITGTAPGESVEEIERVFSAFDSDGPRLRHPATHVILSLHDQDAARLPLEQRTEAIRRLMTAQGYVLSPWVAVEHLRDDSGQPCEWHAHVIALQKSAWGQRVSDSFSRLTGRALLMQIEQQHGLIRTPARARTRTLPRTRSSTRDPALERELRSVRANIHHAAGTATDLPDFVRRLAVYRIKTRFAADPGGTIVGIGFQFTAGGREHRLRGSQLGADCSWSAIGRQPRLKYDPTLHDRSLLMVTLAPRRPRLVQLLAETARTPEPVVKRLALAHPSLEISGLGRGQSAPSRSSGWSL